MPPRLESAGIGGVQVWTSAYGLPHLDCIEQRLQIVRVVVRLLVRGDCFKESVHCATNDVALLVGVHVVRTQLLVSTRGTQSSSEH